MPRTSAPCAWIPVPGVEDGMAYAYAVGQDSALIVVPVGLVGPRTIGPVSEDARAVFDQPTVRGWWGDMVYRRALPGFHAVPLLPVFWDIRKVFTPWPRRFAGILYYRDAAELRAAVKEMRAWADRVEYIETIVVSLKGTVPFEEIRPTLDATLDARYHVLV